VPLVCLAGPVLCYVLKQSDKVLLGGYAIGNELVLVNACITFLLLLLISVSRNAQHAEMDA
jgi:hypothetical protein